MAAWEEVAAVSSPAVGAELVPMRVDDEGLCVECLGDNDVDIVMVTLIVLLLFHGLNQSPSFLFEHGGTDALLQRQVLAGGVDRMHDGRRLRRRERLHRDGVV